MCRQASCCPPKDSILPARRVPSRVRQAPADGPCVLSRLGYIVVPLSDIRDSRGSFSATSSASGFTCASYSCQVQAKLCVCGNQETLRISMLCLSGCTRPTTGKLFTLKM